MLGGWEQGLAVGAGAAAAVGLLAGGCAYAAMWPASQVFGATLIAPARRGELALTFDDGPNPAWTPRLLDVLGGYGVRATFFLVGRYVEAEPELARAIAAAGHVIGNHSWSHPNLALCAANRIREELGRTQDVLQQTVGVAVRHFRPPFGARRPEVLRRARSLGMIPVMWNAMTNDWEERDPGKIAERIAMKVDAAEDRGRGANIVLHDGGHVSPRADRGPSVAAVEKLLEKFELSHRFVTVDEWN